MVNVMTTYDTPCPDNPSFVPSGFSKHLSSIHEKAVYGAGSALLQESPKLDGSDNPQKARAMT